MAKKKIDAKQIEAVKALTEQGKKKGSLTYSEIGNALSEINIDKDQIEDIYDSLAAMGIEVIADDDEDIDVDEKL